MCVPTHAVSHYREPNEEDLIFEDFARLRLRGESAD